MMLFSNEGDDVNLNLSCLLRVRHISRIVYPVLELSSHVGSQHFLYCIHIDFLLWNLLQGDTRGKPNYDQENQENERNTTLPESLTVVYLSAVK